MSDASNQPQEFTKQQWIIDVLARETSTPAEVVKDLYVIEHTKLERVARIKNYVAVLASRRVKLILCGARVANDASHTH